MELKSNIRVVCSQPVRPQNRTIVELKFGFSKFAEILPASEPHHSGIEIKEERAEKELAQSQNRTIVELKCA